MTQVLTAISKKLAPLTVILAALVLGFFGLVALGAIQRLAGITELWIDGETFGVDLVNDTDEPLLYGQCVGEDCSSYHKEREIAPGGVWKTSGTAGVATWFAATGLNGEQLGCFSIDFDEAPSGLELPASQVVACP